MNTNIKTKINNNMKTNGLSGSRRFWGPGLATALILGMAVHCVHAQQETGADVESAAAAAEQTVPPWPAKSNREMMAMRVGTVPGPDFTGAFSKRVVRIKMRD